MNDFEVNEVVAQISGEFKSSTEIEHVNANHSRHIGLSFSDPGLLRDLAEYALKRVSDLTEEAQRQLLPIVRTIPIAKIKAFGVAEFGSGGTRDKVSKRRPRP